MGGEEALDNRQELKKKATRSTTRDLCGERERQGRGEETKKKEKKKAGG